MFIVVRAGRIERPTGVWKTPILPLNYARIKKNAVILAEILNWSNYLALFFTIATTASKSSFFSTPFLFLKPHLKHL